MIFHRGDAEGTEFLTFHQKRPQRSLRRTLCAALSAPHSLRLCGESFEFKQI